MSLTYRDKRRLQRAGLVGLVALLVGILVWFCWVIWLERYVVYSREGATLDFGVSDTLSVGQIATPPVEGETVPIYINEGSDAINVSTELVQINGYFIDSEMLETDVNTARDLIATLPSGTAVMVELKTIWGKFHYSSDLTDAVLSNANTNAVDSLITDITSRNLYAIAMVPAFRDRNYGLNHVSAGLAIPKKGYLWVDDQKCYWLDPTDSETITWLRQIVEELKSLGFDEVMFTEFRIPDTQNIELSGDRTEIINNAAAKLVSACATDNFALSFMAADAGFKLPEGRARQYMDNVGAKNVASVAAGLQLADPKINLVVMATTNDTRFNEYSVLRPIAMAATGEN